MNYFKDCTTIDEAKNLFRKLCYELHPDTSGGDTEQEFIKMYNSFKSWKPTAGTKEQQEFNAEKFYNLVKLFDGLQNVKVSFIGIFIWLEDATEGATYEQKEQIKGINIEGYSPARWARKKKRWYFSPTDYKQKAPSKTKTFEGLKSKFGCNTFNVNQRHQLTY